MEDFKPIKVIIKTDNYNNIIDINSEVFVADVSNWLQIDEGYGDRYAHAQSQYLDKPLINDKGQYNYKLIDGKIVEA